MCSTPSYFLVGVDGGGTGSRIVISDPDGARVAEATGGPANFTTDPQETAANVLSALENAASDALLPSDWHRKSVAHFGLAGIMGPLDAAAVATTMPFPHLTVTDDRATSLAGALGDQNGLLAAIGTGTIIAARQGAFTRFFGGWGHDLADQASGGWLGHRALRHTLMAHDGILEHSDLTRALLEYFNGHPNEVVHFSQKAHPGDYASFAPMVVKAALLDDHIALPLMQQGYEYLKSCFETAGIGDESVICLSGGLGPHYEPYLEKEYHRRLRAPMGTALDGALFLARQRLNKMGGLS